MAKYRSNGRPVSTVCVDCSVFDSLTIPYPKREFLTDDDNEDKADTGASKVGGTKVSMPPTFLSLPPVAYIYIACSS